jgi:cyclophilin family peptidyl-prolyl cis-trans isomerase
MKKIILLSILLLPSSIFHAQSFTGKPQYQIITKRAGNYLGTIDVELFPAIAPLATRNFDSLVSTQFYDSTAFHRVIPGFMIQGGDPNSRHGARSTWGYGDSTQPCVPAEFSAAKHVRGILSAARDTGINSANSQFFICVAAAPWLDGQYSIYGRVVSGMDVVDTIVMQPRDSVDNPYQKIEMFITYLGENDTLATIPTLISPLNYSYSNTTNRLLKWNAASDDIIYHVQVSTDSTFATTYRNVDVGKNQYLVTGLTMGNTYYWRVKSNNGGDTSNYSVIWNFGVSPTGIQTYTNADPISVTPNPGNGQFTFSGTENDQTIEVFDVTGKNIYTRKISGNSIGIDLREYASGIYFYRVSGKNTVVQQGKLIVD